jgi:hypothetical protein
MSTHNMAMTGGYQCNSIVIGVFVIHESGGIHWYYQHSNMIYISTF